MRSCALVLATALAMATLPRPGAAQGCGLAAGPGVALAGGPVHYDLAAGLDGFSAGADLALAPGPVAVRLGYRRMLLEGDGADPDVVRGAVAVPVRTLAGIDVCATGYAGATRFSVDADDGLILAGGLGITVARSRTLGVGGITPFLTVRGLGARTTGEVLGFDLDASGLSLGAEGGAAMWLGPLAVRLTGSVDGFDGGLGTTPFPGWSVELAAAYPF